ncbi:hypothetical protein [Thermotoga sp. KOL6]|uniref:hypothetical protein n=1 Tax=Thermotoga sp. KOL6 TaxID=126741 RepID=UPI001E39A2AC|nr:hypothetical protein [Thermotoga sp. KOL6]
MLVFFLGVPAILSLIRFKIIEAVGYFIFWLGGFSPHIYEKVTQQEIPEKTKLMLSSSIFLHSILGQFLNFYERIAFWDKYLHFYGSFVITYFFYQILTRRSKYWRQVNPSVFMAFLLGAFSGLLWEIAEFITDKVVPGYHTQKGLDDTMLDLVFDLLGCYVMAKVLYKKKTGHLFWHPSR